MCKATKSRRECCIRCAEAGSWTNVQVALPKPLQVRRCKQPPRRRPVTQFVPDRVSRKGFGFRV